MNLYPFADIELAQRIQDRIHKDKMEPRMNADKNPD